MSKKSAPTEGLISDQTEDLVGSSSHALFACPFCNEPAIVELNELEKRLGIRPHAECTNQKCRAFGPDAKTVEEAAALWNKRNSPFCNACLEPDCEVSGDGTCAMIRKYLANIKSDGTDAS